MSVSSIRKAISAAFADKVVTRNEARDIGQLARTKYEKMELAKAMKEDVQFEDGVKDYFDSIVGPVSDPGPASFEKDLRNWATERWGAGEDFGKRVGSKDLPTAVRSHFEALQSQASDGCAAEKARFQGKDVYVLLDFSCVSSATFYLENGKKLFMLEG